MGVKEFLSDISDKEGIQDKDAFFSKMKTNYGDDTTGLIRDAGFQQGITHDKMDAFETRMRESYFAEATPETKEDRRARIQQSTAGVQQEHTRLGEEYAKRAVEGFEEPLPIPGMVEQPVSTTGILPPTVEAVGEEPPTPTGPVQPFPERAKGAEIGKESALSYLTKDVIDQTNLLYEQSGKEGGILGFGQGTAEGLMDYFASYGELLKPSGDMGAVVREIDDKLDRYNKEEDVEFSPEELNFIRARHNSAETMKEYADEIPDAYKYGTGLGQSLGFVADILLTGGLAKGATAGARLLGSGRAMFIKGTGGTITRNLAEEGIKLGAKGARSQIIKRGALSGAQMVKHIATKTAMLPSLYIRSSEQIAQGMDPAQATKEVYFDLFREITTEIAGSAFFPGILKPGATGALGEGAVKKLQKSLLKRVGSSVGEHGLIGGSMIEMGEEVLKFGLDRIAGADDRSLLEYLNEEGMQTLITVGAMQSILGTTAFVGSKAFSYANKGRADKLLEEAKMHVTDKTRTDIDLIVDNGETTVADKARLLNEYLKAGTERTSSLEDAKDFAMGALNYAYHTTRADARHILRAEVNAQQRAMAEEAVPGEEVAPAPDQVVTPEKVVQEGVPVVPPTDQETMQRQAEEGAPIVTNQAGEVLPTEKSDGGFLVNGTYDKEGNVVPLTKTKADKLQAELAEEYEDQTVTTYSYKIGEPPLQKTRYGIQIVPAGVDVRPASQVVKEGEPTTVNDAVLDWFGEQWYGGGQKIKPDAFSEGEITEKDKRRLILSDKGMTYDQVAESIIERLPAEMQEGVDRQEMVNEIFSVINNFTPATAKESLAESYKQAEAEGVEPTYTAEEMAELEAIERAKEEAVPTEEAVPEAVPPPVEAVPPVEEEAPPTPEEVTEVPFRVSDEATQTMGERVYPFEALADMQNKFGLPIELIHSNEMPENIKRAEAKLQGEKEKAPQAKAYFTNGKVFVLADRIGGIADAKRTYLHEVIGHKSLGDLFAEGNQEVLGKSFEDWNGLMDAIYNGMTVAQRKRVAKQYNLDIEEDSRKIADEFIADMAEEPQAPSKWKYFLDQLTNIVRKALGLSSNQFSQNDLKRMMKAHKETLSKDKSTVSTEDQTAQVEDVEDEMDIAFRIVGENAYLQENVRDNLDIAKEMKEKGEDPNTIFIATGWQQGAEGKWRYELPDSKINTNVLNDIFRNSKYPNKKLSFESLVYVKNQDGTYDLSMSIVAPKERGDVVEYNNVDERNLPYYVSDQDIVDKIRKEEGEDDLGGKDFVPAKRIEQKFTSTVRSTVQLRDLLDDKSLFELYPKLKIVDVTVQEGTPRGSFSRVNGIPTIKINPIFPDATLVHEIQHAIQGIEGFASGGNIKMFKDNLLSSIEDKLYLILEIEAYAKHGNIDPVTVIESNDYSKEDQDYIKDRVEKGWDDAVKTAYKSLLTPEQRYERLAGEVEARNVSKRRRLTEEARRKIPLQETEDILRRLQEVRFRITPQDESINTQADEVELVTNEGGQLLAPNGQVSNLDERQWRQVRTPAFKEFFGDWENDPENSSKVVDDNGEPKVLYHGSKNKFENFDLAEIGTGKNIYSDGIFFAEDKAMAEYYGGEVYDVFLNIRDPFIADFYGTNWEGHIKGQELIDHPTSIEPFLREQEMESSEEIDPEQEYWIGYSSNDIAEKARQEGGDGAIAHDIIDGGSEGKTTEIYVAIEPTQVKSATENIGTFSPETEDIRFRTDIEGATPNKEGYFRRISNPKDITTKEQIAEYNAQIEILNNAYKNGYLTEAMAYDIDSDWVIQSYGDNSGFDEIVAEKMDEIEDIQQQELDSGEKKVADYLDEFNMPDNISLEDMARLSRTVTENINVAGYILQNGDLLNFAGEGGGSERWDDHRQLDIPTKENLSGTDLMIGFQKETGAIRMDYNSGSLDLEKKPSKGQVSAMKRVMQEGIRKNGNYYIDLADGGRTATIEGSSIEMGLDRIDAFYEGKDIGQISFRVADPTSEEFKEWHEGSKVKDLVFHGTPDARRIEESGEYEPGISGDYFFFTDSRYVASTYADDRRAWDYQMAEPRVMSNYINMENPLVIDAKGARWRNYEYELEGEKLKGTKEITSKAKELGYDGVIVKNVVDVYNIENRPEKATAYTVFSPDQVRVLPREEDVRAEAEDAGLTDKVSFRSAYHGTDADFDIFKLPKDVEGENVHEYYGNAVYFSGQRDVAKYYGKNVKEIDIPDDEIKTIINAGGRPIKFIGEEVEDAIKKGGVVHLRNVYDSNIQGGQVKDFPLSKKGDEEYKYPKGYHLSVKVPKSGKKRAKVESDIEEATKKVASPNRIWNTLFVQFITKESAEKLFNMGYPVIQQYSRTPELQDTYIIADEATLKRLTKIDEGQPQEAKIGRDYPTPGQILEAGSETETDPSEAQKEAGNYPKGKLDVYGIDISIENPTGSVRSGTDAKGRDWEIVMPYTYGYMLGTKGNDKDHIDVFLNDNVANERAYIVDQVNPNTGVFDEHKVLIGFDNVEDARRAYLESYEEGWTGLGDITPVTMRELKDWAFADGRRTKPFASTEGWDQSVAFSLADSDKGNKENRTERYERLYIDAKLPVKKMQRSMTVSDEADVYAGLLTLPSRVQAEMEENFERKVLEPAVENIGGIMKNRNIDFSELDDYLRAKHALERNKAMRAKDVLEGNEPRDTYSGLTDAEANKVITGFEKRLSGNDRQEIWKSVRSITRYTLNNWYKYNFISEETYNTYKTMYQYYVPLRGWDESVTDEVPWEYLGAQINSTDGSNPDKIAKGRSSLSFSPLSTMVMMAQNSVLAGMKNMTKTRIYNLMQENPEQVGKVFSPRTPESPDVPSVVFTHQPQTRQAQHFVPMMVNGERHVVEFANPSVARSITGKDESGDFWLNKFYQTKTGTVLAKMTRFMAQASTSMNPAFIPVNFFFYDMPYATLKKVMKGDISGMMDLTKGAIRSFPKTATAIRKGSSYLMDQYKETADQYELTPADIEGVETGDKKVVNDIKQRLGTRAWKNIANAVEKKQMHDFIMNGGRTGYAYQEDATTAKKNVGKMLKREAGQTSTFDELVTQGVLNQVGSWMETMGRMSEDATRFGAYRASRRAGNSIPKSVIEAKEASVNFNRKGVYTSGINSTFMFFNAALQSHDNFARMIRQVPTATVTMMITTAMIGYLEAYFNALMSTDGADDDYWRISPFTRRNNIIIGEYKIPLPHVMRPFHSMGVSAFTYLAGKEGLLEAMGGFLSDFQTSALPVEVVGGGVSAWSPTWARPFAEVGANKNFMGLPISKEPFTPELEKTTATWERATKWTSQPFIDASKYLNELFGGEEGKRSWLDETGFIDPAKVEHIARGYFGGLYTLSANVVETARKSMAEGKQDFSPTLPVIRRVLATRRTKNLLWDLSKESKKRADLTEELTRKVDEAIAKDIPEKERNKMVNDFKKSDEFIMANKAYALNSLYRKLKMRITEMSKTYKRLTAQGKDDEADATREKSMRFQEIIEGSKIRLNEFNVLDLETIKDQTTFLSKFLIANRDNPNVPVSELLEKLTQ